MVQSISDGRAKTKLAIFAFLYFGEFVKNCFDYLSVIGSGSETPKIVIHVQMFFFSGDICNLPLVNYTEIQYFQNDIKYFLDSKIYDYSNSKVIVICTDECINDLLIQVNIGKQFRYDYHN